MGITVTVGIRCRNMLCKPLHNIEFVSFAAYENQCIFPMSILLLCPHGLTNTVLDVPRPGVVYLSGARVMHQLSSHAAAPTSLTLYYSCIWRQILMTGLLFLRICKNSASGEWQKSYFFLWPGPGSWLSLIEYAINTFLSTAILLYRNSIATWWVCVCRRS